MGEIIGVMRNCGINIDFVEDGTLVRIGADLKRG